MKNALLTLSLILLGGGFAPVSLTDQWPYEQSGFYPMEDEDDEYDDNYPAEGESMPDIDGSDYYDPDEYEDQDSDSEDDDDSIWMESDDK